jgi:hypothetical protein
MVFWFTKGFYSQIPHVICYKITHTAWHLYRGSPTVQKASILTRTFSPEPFLWWGPVFLGTFPYQQFFLLLFFFFFYNYCFLTFHYFIEGHKDSRQKSNHLIGRFAYYFWIATILFCLVPIKIRQKQNTQGLWRSSSCFSTPFLNSEILVYKKVQETRISGFFSLKFSCKC